MNKQEKEELKKACRLVENHCRSLGKDCEIVFCAKEVQIATPAWAGCSVGNSLFEALEDALNSLDY